MAIRTGARALWFDQESTYDTDPDNTGAGYLSVPALSIGDMQDGKSPLAVRYHTGTPFPTEHVEGVDSWSFTMDIPLIGLAAAAGDGVSPGADDWLDVLLQNFMGTQGTTDGEGLSGATASGMTLDAAAVLADNDFVPVYDAATTRAHSQWTFVTDDSSDPVLVVAPNWAETPTATAIAYGTKYYSLLSTFTGGNTLSVVYQEDTLQYICTGGQITSASISMNVGEVVTMSLTVSGATKALVSGTHASLPATAAASSPTALKGVCSPFYFDGTEYKSQTVEIDLNLQAGHVMATSSCTGKSAGDVVSAEPTITVVPLTADANLNLMRNAGTGRGHVQIGGGILASGVLNTAGLHFIRLQAQEVSKADDEGRDRQSIQFRSIIDGGTELLRLARA